MTISRQTTDLAEVEHQSHRPASGLWRPLYVEMLASLGTQSVLDLGSGSPELLVAMSGVKRRLAIDAGARWADAYRDAGIEFLQVDLNRTPLPKVQPVEAVVCTDVFEHLLFPRRVLEWIADCALVPDGVLVSHVPNEFTPRRTIDVMLGRRDATYFHPHLDEDEDPHLRRFTDIGFRRFLSRSFSYSVPFAGLNSSRVASTLDRCGLPVPFCLQPGPGYISTNSPHSRRRADEVVARIPSRQSRKR